MSDHLETLLLLRIYLQPKRRKLYMRELFLTRKNRGHFKILIPDLISDEDMFFNYFWMSKSRFSDLLRRVGPSIQHKPTHRQPIGAEERLRILAS